MVRRIHDHRNEGGRFAECDCPNPGGPEPSWDHPVLHRLVTGERIDQLEAEVDSRGRHRLLYLRPQHIGTCAVVVGMGSYAIAALTPWWLTLAIGLALLALLVVAGRRDWLAIDRTPTARLLRR
jgi:hypothetical protein